jgi:hypothetical protein
MTIPPMPHRSDRPHRSFRRFAAVLAFFLGLAAAGRPALANLSSVRSALYSEGNMFLLAPAVNDEFAHTVAVGDFDGDGADDLVTSVPFDDNVGALYPNSGIVLIRYGVPGQGLAGGTAGQILSQAFGGSPDPAEEEDRFGLALAAGDFDDDGFDDLAVGIPLEDNDDDGACGAVQVYYGSVSGLDLGFAQLLGEDSSGVPGESDGGDQFGAALAAADFDGDGFADLAVGVPGEGDPDIVGDAAQYGSVNVFYGGAAGLSGSGAQRFTQDFMDMDGSTEDFDHFGAELAAADFDGDGHADLAVGVPGENDGGGVHFIFGTSSGLATARNNLWTQDDGGVLDDDELEDQFGASLAAGDFTGDGYADLAIGAFGEDIEPAGGGPALTDAGAVHIFVGSASGISSANSSLWNSSVSGLATSESGERWGYALAAGDFDKDGRVDLAIGAPREGLGSEAWAGEVTVLRGAPTGLTGSGGQLLNQNTPGVPGANEQGDEFARALAAGDFDRNGHADLAIGAPRETVVATGDGAEWVLYGALFADGFESGAVTSWSAVLP